uniref:Antigen 5 family member n=1 Tax=Rhipicephalus appendiculatus TaxID=34631 RepID=A0A131Z3J6_RHIAP
MSLSASLSVTLLIAALSAPALCQQGYLKGIGGTPGLAERGEGAGEVRASSGYEPTDFNGVFTRSMRNVQRQVRRRHNYYRRRHDAQPLESDDSLDRYAQAWAYHLAKIGRPMHRRACAYGENIFHGYYDAARPINGRDAVDAWYNEIRQYDFNKNHPQYGTREFAQIVWKETTALGTGIARGNGSSYFLVTVYDPRGNIRGEYLKNVKQPNVEGGEIRPVLPPQQVPAPMPQPVPMPMPAPLPPPMPAPLPRPEQRPGAIIIPGSFQNQAGQSLFRLKKCPGKKPIMLNLKVSPN